ncbi:hypothetical protein [Pseudarthrobacter sp. SSS035]|nr:hypothetical protein [Pseudarthrobacter sp. SSS035]
MNGAADVTALAVVGGTPVFLRLGPPTYPVNYFTDEKEALIWLQTTG